MAGLFVMSDVRLPIAVYEVAAADGIFYLSVQWSSGERSVAGFGTIFGRRPTFFRIKDNQIRSGVLFDLSVRKPVKSGRIDRHFFKKLHQSQMSRTYKGCNAERQ